MKAGDYFGELALIENIARSATIICKTDSSFAVLEQNDFNNLISKLLNWNNIFFKEEAQENQLWNNIWFLRDIKIFGNNSA